MRLQPTSGDFETSRAHRSRLGGRALAGSKEGATDVDPNLLTECAREAGLLLAVLEAGDRPNLQLSVSFGSAFEFLLCDLFKLHAAAACYWVDGLLVDATMLTATRVVVVKGRAWCADHKTQWQVPAEIICEFSEAGSAVLQSMRIAVGNAAFGSLSEHRDRNVTRREPREWLLEFRIAGLAADREADIEVHYATGTGE
jgi:hypothetical protein